MGDTFLNVLFIVVVAVVFIGRTILSAKKKKEPPPKVVIPVHFEDDEPAYFKNKAANESPRTTTAKPAIKKAPALALPLSTITEIPLSNQVQSARKTPDASQAKTGPVRVPVPTPEQQRFPLNLNHLSPLKQAVVMAEILGPPKGLS